MRFMDTYYDLIIVLFHICAPLTEANHGNRNGSTFYLCVIASHHRIAAFGSTSLSSRRAMR